MGDPLSVVSGILAIVTATVQSSKALYQAIQSFRDHPRAVRQLINELEALTGVLHSLESLARGDASIFVPLKLPLTQCCQACGEFKALIVKHTARSRGSKSSFRDWATLRYMDSDINGFTTMLAGYKSTISVALADANLLSAIAVVLLFILFTCFFFCCFFPLYLRKTVFFYLNIY